MDSLQQTPQTNALTLDDDQEKRRRDGEAGQTRALQLSSSLIRRQYATPVQRKEAVEPRAPETEADPDAEGTEEERAEEEERTEEKADAEGTEDDERAEEEERAEIADQDSPAAEKEKEEAQSPVQMTGGAEAGRQPKRAARVAARGVEGASAPLPFGDRIQASFGHHDLSSVRVRSGGPAAEASEALGAEAYTTGSSIGFRGTPDLRTAAHEAAHVVQQRGGVHLKGGVGEPGDRYEQQADQIADLAVRGQSAQAVLDGAASSTTGRAGAVQMWWGSEHKKIGTGAPDLANRFMEKTGKTKLNDKIKLGKGITVTFGELTAIAGDYFGSPGQLHAVLRQPDGKDQVRWALWDACGKGSKPRNAAAVKKARDRYRLLATRNTSHFSEGGSAGATYQGYHEKALFNAWEAGRTTGPASAVKWNRALRQEGFAAHHLADMFAAGHIRTPARDIRKDYKARFPDSSDLLIKEIAKRVTKHLIASDEVPRAAKSKVESKIAAMVRKEAGPLAKAFGLGDLVLKAYHDHDNQLPHGIEVSSKRDETGAVGPHNWLAAGEGTLLKSGTAVDNAIRKKTLKMSRAATAVSLTDLEKARAAATSFQGETRRETIRRDRVFNLAHLKPYLALDFVPKLRNTESNAAMAHKWGSLDAALYAQLNKIVKGFVADNLAGANLPKVVDAVPRKIAGIPIRGIPLGPITPRHITTANYRIHPRPSWKKMVASVRAQGIKFLELAVGSPAK